MNLKDLFRELSEELFPKYIKVDSEIFYLDTNIISENQFQIGYFDIHDQDCFFEVTEDRIDGHSMGKCLKKFDEILETISYEKIDSPILKEDKLQEELQELLNKYKEGGVTPSSILANYMLGCLKNFNKMATIKEY